MKVHFTTLADEDVQYWRQHDKKLAEQVKILVADILEHPFTGIGKPEPLKFQWSGYWSRRINKTHRIVYKVHGDTVYIVQCRFHF